MFTPDKVQKISVDVQTNTPVTGFDADLNLMGYAYKVDKGAQSFEDCLRLSSNTTLDVGTNTDTDQYTTVVGVNKCLQSFEGCIKLKRTYNRRATLQTTHLPLFYYGQGGPTRQLRDGWRYYSNRDWSRLGQSFKVDCVHNVTYMGESD
jgi:hypothetical protein